jgi:hypothetical protein
MATAIIDLNDSEIRLATQGNILLRQPGYAVLKTDTILTGKEAWRIARSNPRATYNRYWSQLSQDSLVVPSHLVRHHADLAYAQLLALHEQAGKPEEVVFALPGHYTREQLALLLGIAQACPFTAVGLVDAATACVSAIADTGSYSHIDIHLHYALITTLEVTDQVSRTSVRIIDAAGTADIYETCAAYMADQFVDQARFDPLHHAETEQLLYDQIPSSLGSMQAADEVMLEISYKNKRYQARIFRDALLEKLKKHYERIYREVSGQSVSLISDRLHALPGFTNRLDNAVVLEDQAVFQGCHINLQNIRTAGPSLSFITTLPSAKTPQIPAIRRMPISSKTAISQQTGSTATHILINHRACALTSQPIYVSADGTITHGQGDRPRHCSFRLGNQGALVSPEGELTVFLNGNRLTTERPTLAGDAISFAGSDTIIRLIEVAGG